MMPSTLCTQCSATVPVEARFCPRCGHQVAKESVRPARSARSDVTGAPPEVPAGNRAAGALPSSSRMPLAGILFLIAAVLGPTMIAVGVSTGYSLLIVTGIGIAVVLIAVLLIGLVF